MRRTVLAEVAVGLAVMVLFAGSLLLAGRNAAAAEKTLRLLYSGDVAGYLEPCG